MKQAFRVAVIGCGAICGNHIQGLLSAEQQICALCDVDLSQCERIMEKYGLPDLPVYTDYLQLLDAERPDAVHICTPHYLHAEMTVAALERGIHVLCEKPMAISHEQLDRVLAAAKRSTAQLGVCMQNRYEPTILRAKELAQSEGIRAAYGDVVWKRDADYYASGDWRGTWREEGGGVMINQALHTLDLLQWICGMPERVVAHIANDHLPGVIEVEDTAVAHFSCPNGSSFHFFATTACGATFPAHLRFYLNSKKKLHAEASQLILDGEVLFSKSSGDAHGKAVWGAGHTLLISDFYRCIGEGIPFPIHGEEAAKVIRLILAMYGSNGAPISL
ncbi:MAG: Gfo/Idh/MocA family oxidoreductase [Clostridia bacterium]|nr:Gfo/Idh/MocA family oxidoreductase [Clostridia bacterium]